MKDAARPPVRGRFVRVFHWSNAALVIATCFLLDGGDKPHAWAGYGVAALVAARIIWGFIGSANARFTSFLPTPTRMRNYLAGFHAPQRDGLHSEPTYNPVGALMIFTLLTLLVVCSLSGWMQTTDRWWGEEWVQLLHEFASHALMICAGVHVFAVLLLARLTGQPLLRRMLWQHRPDNKMSTDE